MQNKFYAVTTEDSQVIGILNANNFNYPALHNMACKYFKTHLIDISIYPHIPPDTQTIFTRELSFRDTAGSGNECKEIVTLWPVLLFE